VGKSLVQRVRRRNRKHLRTQSRLGKDIGGLCTGALILAKSGLLDGGRSTTHWATTHWENVAGFSEDYPDIEVSSKLFDITYSALLSGTVLQSSADTVVANEPFDHRRGPGLRFRLGIAFPQSVTEISSATRHAANGAFH